MTAQRTCPLSFPAGAPSRQGSRRPGPVVALGLVGAVWLYGLAAAHNGRVMVVVNSEGPLTTATKSEIRDVFLGKLRFMGDVPIRPIQLAGPARAVLLRWLMGMSEREFHLHWARKAYEDGVVPPPVLSTSAEALERVTQEKGAVAFVDESGFQSSERVKVLYEIEANEAP